MSKSECPCVTFTHKPDFLCDCDYCFEFFYFLQSSLDQLEQDVNLLDSYMCWHSRFSTANDTEANYDTEENDNTEANDDTDTSSIKCNICTANNDGNEIPYCDLCINYFGVCQVCHINLAENKHNICDSCDSYFENEE